MQKILFLLLLGAGLVASASDKLPIGNETLVRTYFDKETTQVIGQTWIEIAPNTWRLLFQDVALRTPGQELAEVIHQNVTAIADRAKSDGLTNKYSLTATCNNKDYDRLMLGQSSFVLDVNGGYPSAVTNVANYTNLQWRVPVVITNVQWARIVKSDGVVLDDTRTNSGYGYLTNIAIGNPLFSNTNTLYVPMYCATGAITGNLEIGIGPNAESTKIKRYDLISGVRIYESPARVTISLETNTPVIKVTGDWEAGVALEQSPDLLGNWVAMTNIVLSTDGVGEIRCQSTNSSPARFYRARYAPE